MSNSKRKPSGGRPGGKPSGKSTGKPAGSKSFTGKTAAQQRLAAQRAMAAASGRTSARRKRFLTVIAPIAAVAVIVAVLVIVKVATGKDKPTHTTSAAAQQVVAKVTNVPADVLDAIGAGTGDAPRQKLTGAALTANGLPRVLYVGAEWCPYCAAERWPLAVALSRFGTLTDLGETKSAADDTDPNTPTLSFHGSKYSSTHIAFSGIELEDGAHKPLDSINEADNKLFTTIGGSGFPFIDIAGKYYFSVQFDPGVLKGKTHAQIATALSDKSSKIAKAVDGSANILTAAICEATSGQPAAVCNSAGVVAGKAKLSNAGT